MTEADEQMDQSRRSDPSMDPNRWDRMFLRTFVNGSAPTDDLTQALQGYRRGALEAYGDELALELSPDLNRRALIAQLAAGILWRLDAWLLAADNDELNLLDELCAQPTVLLSEPEAVEAASWDLMALGFAHLFRVGAQWQVVVPKQICARLAAFLDDPQVPRERGRVRIVTQTADALAHLYGVYPPDVLLDVVREVCHLSLTEEELDHMLDRFGWDFRGACLDRDLNLLMDQELMDNGVPQEIWLMAGDRPFWQPDPETLAHCLDHRTDEQAPEYIRLQEWLNASGSDRSDDNDSGTAGFVPLIDEIVFLALSGAPLRDIVLMLHACDVLTAPADVVMFSSLYLDWRKGARLWFLRGARPVDDPQDDPLAERVPDLETAAEWLSAGEDLLEDDPAEQERVPSGNELCPCGSGRKYKNCCGRDRLT